MYSDNPITKGQFHKSSELSKWMILLKVGRMVQKCWLQTTNLRTLGTLDQGTYIQYSQIIG